MRLSMHRYLCLSLGVIGLSSGFANAATVLLNGFDNTLNGYSTTGGDPSLSLNGYSTTTGVTQGTYSAAVKSSGGGPGYGQFLQSGYSAATTAALLGATAINLDVYAPSGTFGGYLQFKIQLQFSDAPTYTYIDLGGFDGPHSANLGGEATISFAITPTVQAQIAAAAAANYNTNLYISVGGGTATAGDSFNLDNLTVTTPTPEPASLGLLGLAGTSLLARRRRA